MKQFVEHFSQIPLKNGIISQIWPNVAFSGSFVVDILPNLQCCCCILWWRRLWMAGELQPNSAKEWHNLIKGLLLSANVGCFRQFYFIYFYQTYHVVAGYYDGGTCGWWEYFSQILRKSGRIWLKSSHWHSNLAVSGSFVLDIFTKLTLLLPNIMMDELMDGGSTSAKFCQSEAEFNSCAPAIGQIWPFLGLSFRTLYKTYTILLPDIMIEELKFGHFWQFCSGYFIKLTMLLPDIMMEELVDGGNTSAKFCKRVAKFDWSA